MMERTAKIFLIGYMGSGKTTLGRAVAGRRAAIDFIDLDDYIEASQGKSISRIFAERGEKGFRDIEREALRHLVEQPGDALIACGGGTPCHFDNMDYMNVRGTTVLLQASMGTLMRRLTLLRSTRPLIADLTDEQLEDFIADNLAKRMAYYGKAAITFCSDRLETEEEIEETANDFIRLLKL
ncbi:MAG: shikimate kinase [Muribaculaceae bacterium]|nr:shikimate kinase [Muribaculaceae bacterium]